MAEPNDPGSTVVEGVEDVSAAKSAGGASAGTQGSFKQQIEDAETAVKNLTKTFEGALQAISGNLEEVLKAKAASFIEYTVFKLQDAALQPMINQLHAVEDLGKDTVEVASIMQRLSGLNADAMQRADYGIDTLSQKATKGAFDAVNKLADTQIKLLDGTSAYALQISSTEEMLETFTESALNDSRLFSAATKGMSEDILLSSTLATKRLGMTTSDLHEIFYRELAATGEMSGEYLNKIEKDLLAAAKVTGDSIVLMSKDLNRMMADFEHFGALAPEQMLSLSHTMHQLGINLRDVTAIADKFQSFDTAINTMSQLAATTGLTLDAVEMFEMANLDPENLVVKLREELDAQGIEFEQMNIIQQRQMAKAFGIDPTTLRVLMNDNLKAAGGLAEEIASEAGKIDDERRKTLLADMDRLEVTASEELAKRRTSAKTANIETAQAIEKTYSAAAAASVKAMEAAGSLLDAGIRRFKVYRDTLSNVSDELYKAAKIVYVPPGASPPPIEVPGTARTQSGALSGTPITPSPGGATATPMSPTAAGGQQQSQAASGAGMLSGAPITPTAGGATTAPTPPAAAGTTPQAKVVDRISEDVAKIALSTDLTARASVSSAASSASTAASTEATAAAVTQQPDAKSIPASQVVDLLQANKETNAGALERSRSIAEAALKGKPAPAVAPPTPPTSPPQAAAVPPPATPTPAAAPAAPAPTTPPAAEPTPPVASPPTGAGSNTAAGASPASGTPTAIEVKLTADPVAVNSTVSLSLNAEGLAGIIDARIVNAATTGIQFGGGGHGMLQVGDKASPIAATAAPATP